MLGGVIMARRNLRLDRADRAGALRVGMVVGGLVWLAWLCDEHHIAAVWELYLVMAGTGLALFNAAFAATFYLALEPHVRRRWPSMLVSWSRLIAGDVFNPLVARDVLIGAAVMAVAYSLDLSGMLLAQRVTGVLPLLDSSPRPFMGGLHIVSEVAVAAAWAVVLGILFLLLYYIVRRVVRFEWAAVIVGAMLISPASGVIGSGGALVRLPFEFVFLAAMLVVLARVGLVAIIASYLLLFLLIRFPVTWPLTQWYSTTGVIGLTLSLVVVFTAYRIVIRALARPTLSRSR